MSEVSIPQGFRSPWQTLQSMGGPEARARHGSEASACAPPWRSRHQARASRSRSSERPCPRSLDEPSSARIRETSAAGAAGRERQQLDFVLCQNCSNACSGPRRTRTLRKPIRSCRSDCSAHDILKPSSGPQVSPGSKREYRNLGTAADCAAHGRSATRCPSFAKQRRQSWS